MSSTRKLARLAAPVVCAAYVAYVAVDRGYYHIERRKELDAATARAKAEAARRVAADEREEFYRRHRRSSASTRLFASALARAVAASSSLRRSMW